MSGPELTAVVASAAALLALFGVGVLLVQTRRLRSVVEATRAAAPAPDRAPQLEQVVPRESSPQPPSRSVAVVELLPAAPADRPDTSELVVPTQQQVVAVTLAHPLVRVSALAYGLRTALRPENRDRIRALVRRDLRRRHKVRRLAARRAARVVPIRPAPVPASRREESAS